MSFQFHHGVQIGNHGGEQDLVAAAEIGYSGTISRFDPVFGAATIADG